MKKICLVCLMIVVIGVLVGCGDSSVSNNDSVKGDEVVEETSLEGKWVSSNEQFSVLFGNDGTVLVDDEFTGTYTKYDSNKVVININDEGNDYNDYITTDVEYSIKDGMLVLSLLETTNENGFKWYFFTEDRIDDYKNKKYRKNSYDVSFIDSDDIEGYVEKVSEGCKEAQKIVDEEVLPLYNNYSLYTILCADIRSTFFESIPKAEFVYEGVKYYEIMMAPVGYIGGDVDFYAVDLDTGNILKGQCDDEYHITYGAW